MEGFTIEMDDFTTGCIILLCEEVTADGREVFPAENTDSVFAEGIERVPAKSAEDAENKTGAIYRMAGVFKIRQFHLCMLRLVVGWAGWRLLRGRDKGPGRTDERAFAVHLPSIYRSGYSGCLNGDGGRLR